MCPNIKNHKNPGEPFSVRYLELYPDIVGKKDKISIYKGKLKCNECGNIFLFDMPCTDVALTIIKNSFNLER